ncbi:MAG: ABC transporter permease, partial [Allorhizobium sp.]
MTIGTRLANTVGLIEGPQTLGRGPAFWTSFALVILAACLYPLFADGYDVGNNVYFFNWAFMALGLSLIWGYGGTLSFGQTAFFGVAGYTYGVISINFGDTYGLTILALLGAIGLSALLA